jgi:hypothetical protein
MTQVYKYPNTDAEIAFKKIELSISENSLIYTTTDLTDQEHTITLSLDDVRNSLSFGAQNWVSPLKGSRTDKIVSLLDWSDITKRNTLSGDTIKEDYVNLRFFINNTTDNFTDFIYQIGVVFDSETNDVVDTTEIIITGATLSNTNYTWKTAFSPITLSSGTITEGDNSLEVTVSSTNTSLEKVYLKPVCGVLDRTEVKLTNGTGKFKIITNTLESGDIVTVKAGHKKFSNVTTFTKTVS